MRTSRRWSPFEPGSSQPLPLPGVPLQDRLPLADPPGPGKSHSRRLKFLCAHCGRETDAMPGTDRLTGQLCRECFGRGPDRRPRELNDLTGAEWARASRSVEQYPDTRSPKQRLHGACFPVSLASQQIQLYTKRGQTVLDPFVGVGTTLDACADLGRRGIGIELDEGFAKIAQESLDSHPNGHLQKIIVSDARRLNHHVGEEAVDFVLTSPPYGSLLKNVKQAFAFKWREHSMIDAVRNPAPYSDRPEDLGNMDYVPFLDALEDCLRCSLRALRRDSYAVWVVKDFRALGEGVPYVNFHSHLVDRAERVGFVLWDIRIYDQTRYRPLVCLGFPSRNFYLNIGHSYLVVLKKP